MKIKARSIVLLSLTIGLTTIFSSCRKCVEGHGSTITENRVVSANFTGLISDGAFDFDIYQDTTIAADSVVVSINAHKEILPYVAVEVVTTSVESNLLVSMVNHGTCLKYDEPVIITIRVPNLEYLEIAGATDVANIYDFEVDEMVCLITGTANLVYFEELNCNLADVEISGDAKVQMIGVADNTDLKITGSGDIDALDLYAKRCDALISGSGVMNVRVSIELDATITGEGDIYYKASSGADIIWDIPGLGEIIPLKK